jgi:CBS domain-containing protein
MTRKVVTATPDMSVMAARRLLTLHDIRHLPIVVGNEVVGIVSDRDVRISDGQLAASLAGLQSDLLHGRYRRLSFVMTAPALVIHPKTKVHIAAEYMVSRRIGALPVVEDGRLVGIISLSDCVRALVYGAQKHDDGYLPSSADSAVPMPAAGDERPGRPPQRRVAMVVDADPAARLRARDELNAAGYTTFTCPGPSGGTYCPAVRGGEAGPRCDGVPADTDLVLLPSVGNTAVLAETYARWLPSATIRVTPS